MAYADNVLNAHLKNDQRIVSTYQARFPKIAEEMTGDPLRFVLECSTIDMAGDKATWSFPDLAPKMILMSDVIARIDDSDPSKFGDPDLEALESDLQTNTFMGWSEAFNERVKRLPINTWICTDTEVGVNAYYFDGELVALSFQSARKSDVEFRWLSEPLAAQVRDFIISLNKDAFRVSLLKLDAEIDADWLMPQ